MNTLRDRLAELADDAPTAGAPPAELWARGKRAQRIRLTGLGALVLVVVVAGGRVVGLPQGKPDVLLAPAGAGSIALPIDYPVGEDLPILGDAPGPLAAVWLAPREPYTLNDDDAGQAPVAVGLVAATGRFGTLPIDLYAWVYESPDAHLALSPDGRRVAYFAPPDDKEPAGEETSGDLVVHDLVSGDEQPLQSDFEVRSGATWVDATTLVGHVAGGSDIDGWMWELGKPPKLVNPYPYLEDPTGPPVTILESDPPWSCSSPTIRQRTGRSAPSVVCDDVGVVGPAILLGHLKTGETTGLDRPVVALDLGDPSDFPFDEPALRREVVTAGAPYPVAFATDLIADALAVDGNAP